MGGAEILRKRVDEMRAELHSGSLDSVQVVENLALEALRGVSESQIDQSDLGIGRHLCPWHTCQATLHNLS